MATTEDVLLRLEQRVSRLEALVENGALARAASASPPIPVRPAAPAVSTTPATAATPATADAPAASEPAVAASTPRAPSARPVATATDDGLAITRLMGGAGVTLLVLAAAYLIRLVYDTGWFTPGRQVVCAAAFGATLVAAGLRLRSRDAAYASLLPAAGLVILFLATYGAHLVYHLLATGTAAAAVVATCLLALWLGRVFALELYAFFAVAGSYSAPLLLQVQAPAVLDLALYFTAWSLVFCAYALMTASRRPYLLAGYMALVAFSAATRLDFGGWQAIVAFQCVQFAVFLCAAVLYSVVHATPLTRDEAVAHMPLLALFYALQYVVLHAHVPAVAPWLAIASAVVLWAGYALARAVLRVRLEGGAIAASAYGALVFFHAVYLQLVPDRWGPVFALALLPLAALYARVRPVNTPESLPYKVAIALVAGINYLRVVMHDGSDFAGSPQWLTLAFAVELFAAYALLRGREGAGSRASWVLWAAQAAALRFLWLLMGGGLAASTAWALLALAELAIAFRTADQALGKSALLVFALCLAKLVLEDLSHAQPLVRIGSLVVVGIALYAGGALYRRLAGMGGAQPARA